MLKIDTAAFRLKTGNISHIKLTLGTKPRTEVVGPRIILNLELAETSQCRYK